MQKISLLMLKDLSPGRLPVPPPQHELRGYHAVKLKQSGFRVFHTLGGLGYRPCKFRFASPAAKVPTARWGHIQIELTNTFRLHSNLIRMFANKYGKSVEHLEREGQSAMRL